MHIGRQYQFTQFLGWTRWEAGYLIGWSLLVTLLLQVSHWNFLTIPAPVLTIIGSALAIILAFKNQQCYARFNEALALSGQLTTNSLILANRLTSTIGNLDAARIRPGTEGNVLSPFRLADCAALFPARRKVLGKYVRTGKRPISRQASDSGKPIRLESELKTYLPDADVQKVMMHQGDKEALILHWQYEAISRPV